MLDFARQLTLSSAINYITHRGMNREGPVVLKTRKGPRFELRPSGGENNDYGVAYEVFVHDFYNDRGHLRRDEVKLVVDLGANVGLSILYFLHNFPHCRVIAFEPHPAHAVQAVRNLDLDRNRDRVEFYEKAAGASQRAMRLTDAKSSAKLTDLVNDNTLPVEVVDVFPILGSQRIDILKMDIEGGEYEILADERFARLNIGAVVMEWHSRGPGRDDKRWCEERLTGLGFAIEQIFAEASHGMFWARRFPPNG